MTVDHVEPDQQRNAEPRLLDGDSLHVVNVLRSDEVQQVAERAVADRVRGIAGDDGPGDRVRRRGHGELAQLLRQGHPLDQLVNSAHGDNHDLSPKKSLALTGRSLAEVQSVPLRKIGRRPQPFTKCAVGRESARARRRRKIPRSSRRCRTMRCSRPCSARRSAISGKARIPPAASPSTGAPPGKRANDTDPITIGGSGFGVMALIVAAERGWVTRAAALERLDRMLDAARCAHAAITARFRTS